MFGANCTVRNSTTIGNKRLKDGSYSRAPRFGDRVDIGANAGIYSFWAHRCMGGNGRILAVEPDPEMRPTTRQR